jgi:hypothetical protein
LQNKNPMQGNVRKYYVTYFTKFWKLIKRIYTDTQMCVPSKESLETKGKETRLHVLFGERRLET